MPGQSRLGRISCVLQRERSNPGVKFSEGYLNVQQVFISAKKIKKDFPGALKKSRVGAQRKSVNYKSAVMLASQFDFEVVKFDYYADIYRELRSGEIDFGLVDNGGCTELSPNAPCDGRENRGA